MNKKIIVILICLWSFILAWLSWTKLFGIIQDTSWLPNNIEYYYSNLVKWYIQETLAEMLNKKILSNWDIITLNNKIKISYTESCEDTVWSFNAYRHPITGKVVFSNISLIVSYCIPDFIFKKDKKDIKQILTHEIWHYIYFFKDKNIAEFINICWNNKQSKCEASDFITKYASSSQEEDYAESFVYRYLNYKYETEATKMKNEHFNKLFRQPPL